jgi:hypothetical protein
MFDVSNHHRLQQCDELISLEFAIAENRRE